MTWIKLHHHNLGLKECWSIAEGHERESGNILPCLRWQGEAAVWETRFCAFACSAIWMLASNLCVACAVLTIFHIFFPNRIQQPCEFSSLFFLCIQSVQFMPSWMPRIRKSHSSVCYTKDIYWALIFFVHVHTRTHAHQIWTLPTTRAYLGLMRYILTAIVTAHSAPPEART